MNHQRGAIPVLVIVAIILSSLLGGLVGFQLGDGTFFSLGIGIGIGFFLMVLLAPHFSKVLELRDRLSKK